MFVKDAFNLFKENNVLKENLYKLSRCSVSVNDASGFLIENNHENEHRVFLVTSYSLIYRCKNISIIVFKKDGEEITIIAGLNNLVFDKYNDIAIVDVTNEINAKDVDVCQLERDHFNPNNSIENFENYDIWQRTFIVINNKIIGESKSKFSTIMSRCKNITNSGSANVIGAFLVDLPHSNWRLGSPVFWIFKDEEYNYNEIKLVGMINDAKEIPKDFSSVVPTKTILELLK